MRTLPREPWRGGQICGYQSEYGVVPGRTVQCGEFKAPGLYFCRHHHKWVSLDGPIRMAEGNVRGLSLVQDGDRWVVLSGSGMFRAASPDRAFLEKVYGFTLEWEPYEGDMPIPATPEEIAAWQAS